MDHDPAEPPPAQRCFSCGYSLEGVGIGESLATCPECGATFDPVRPPPARPWPRLWVIGLWLSGAMPLAVVLDFLEWQASARGAVGYASALSMATPVAWAAAWLGWPAMGAVLLARRHAHPMERWMAWVGLYIAGLAVNAVVVFAWALLRILLR